MKYNRSLAVLVILCFLLTGVLGCGDKSEEAAGYVQADLDLIFQGETQGAKAYLDASNKDLKEIYENGITAFVETYLTDTDESQKGLTETYSYLVKQIFITMRYKIGEVEKTDKNTYKVEVKYEPVDVFTTFIPELQKETARIEEDAKNGKYEGTDEEIQEAMLSEYLTNSYSLLEDAYRNLEYLEQKTYTFTVTGKGKNTFSMDEDEINTFIVRILALDKL